MTPMHVLEFVMRSIFFRKKRYIVVKISALKFNVIVGLERSGWALFGLFSKDSYQIVNIKILIFHKQPSTLVLFFFVINARQWEWSGWEDCRVTHSVLPSSIYSVAFIECSLCSQYYAKHHFLLLSSLHVVGINKSANLSLEGDGCQKNSVMAVLMKWLSCWA